MAVVGFRVAIFAAGCALLGAVAPASASAADPAVELAGTWFVLVHYQDENHHPERKRWEDKIWVFEPKRSRLKWSEYPIVEFLDNSGRFESRDGRNARVLDFWEPNEAQKLDISDGLQVNERGKLSKSLKRNDQGDWHSLSRASRASASIVSYVQNWSIENLAGLPVFQREDVLGSGETEDLEGITRYTVEAIGADGVLSGSYVRDGTRHGTFRMMRSGDTEAVKGSGLTQGQRAVQIPGGADAGEEDETPP